MATDVMKLHPTPEEIITKHNLKFSRYFQNALTTKYMEFMDNTPSDIDPRLVTEVYLKMYQYAAYTFYPSESASMNTLYNLYHCFTIGQRIAIQRQSLGLSQAEFGQLINRPLRVIQMFENGELELGICLLEEIALKLQTNTNALLGFDEPTPVVASCICNCPLIRTGLLDHVLGEKKNG